MENVGKNIALFKGPKVEAWTNQKAKILFANKWRGKNATECINKVCQMYLLNISLKVEEQIENSNKLAQWKQIFI